MPGISANLTAQAYAIWDSVPKKEARNPRRRGRSAYVSKAIIEHAGWADRYDTILGEKFTLEKNLREAMRTIESLQRKVHE